MKIWGNFKTYLCACCVVFTLAGCLTQESVNEKNDLNYCSSCHGSDNSFAPPKDVKGNTKRSFSGVGAHQSHLKDGKFRKSISCDSCHQVPSAETSDNHIDGLPAEVIFSNLAKTSSVIPEWDDTQKTCGNVYCHGATLQGGNYTSPVWNEIKESFLDCQSCHGNPPPVPHPQNEKCSFCHSSTTDRNGNIIIAGEKHINGVIDVIQGCNSCHGNEKNPAPPKSTKNKYDTTDIAVGAHQTHLNAQRFSKPIACESCHKVPEFGGNDNNHIDGIAKVEFHDLAVTDNAHPEWEREEASCENVYCHGATIKGGNYTEPVWTKVNGNLTCSSCHGNPPPLPHPQNQNCGTCHSSTVDENRNLLVNAGNHINGILDVNTACNSCHGNEKNFAPPKSTRNESDTSSVQVGAHQAHLNASNFSEAIACENCHNVPVEGKESNAHIDGIATVTFKELAVTGGVTPLWDENTASCKNTYCHGASLSGGNDNNPVWVNDIELSCNSCHGNPPPAPHPQDSNCTNCHSQTVDNDGKLKKPFTKHINGKIDTDNILCKSCHGNVADFQSASLFDESLKAESKTIHNIHLQTTLVKDAIDCASCHNVPENIDSEGHRDASPAEVNFSGKARLKNINPSYSYSTQSCQSVYCHGITLSGGDNTHPVWQELLNNDTSCKNCHGNPPPAPHPQVSKCSVCHQQTVDENNVIIVSNDTHINGIVEAIPQNCNSCHGNSDNNAPPKDTNGNTATSFVSVGAHQSHVKESSIRNALDCNDCHDTPKTVDSYGHIEPDEQKVQFGVLAQKQQSTPLWDNNSQTCKNVYCHGNTLPGGLKTEPIWTQVDGSFAQCDSCHGNPPPLPHPQWTTCYHCHTQTVQTDGTINKINGNHINGSLDVNEVPCSVCHGL